MYGLSKQQRDTIGGVVAGACEALCLHPVDTIKTRLQLQRGNHNVKYNGAIHCAKTIVKEEGALALYKGLTPFMLHMMAKYGLRFFTNSVFKGLLSGGQGRPTTNMQNFFAGMGAGIVEAICIVTPFEVVKIRLQSQLGLQKSQLKYTGPVNALIKISREEGIFALWNGVTPTIIRNASNQALNFTAYPFLRRTLWENTESGKFAPWQTILTGAMSGALGPICNGPVDVIKTRLMVNLY
jgi:solute carrier family 25 citrate transporter 1